MGGAASFKPFRNVTFPFFFFFPVIITTTLTPLIIARSHDDSVETNVTSLQFPSLEYDNRAASAPVTSSNQNSAFETFKPSTPVLVGILTALFSLALLLLVYLKHFKGGNTVAVNPNAQTSDERKNSGIDRDVIESLPMFRFESLRGPKNGLDCAVCLMRFEDPEVLRLLPKCKHAFHAECVDTWLDAHSTCPLCRYKVDPSDVVLVDDATRAKSRSTDEELDIERGIIGNQDDDASEGVERDEGTLELVLHTTNGNAGTTSFESEERIKRGDEEAEGKSAEHRLEHRIIVSRPCSPDGGVHHRWSDVGPSDLLYLKPEMITWKARGRGRGGGGGGRSIGDNNSNNNNIVGEVDVRCVSEMTGMRRFENVERREQEEQPCEGVDSGGWVGSPGHNHREMYGG
ncbi:hypothetical protein VNO77_31745 [Canavalia gladiata]|uniref:RING-type E3 ubiquitin transferase n=1 Tax=Canavalia gladiata TaxID=3824 RepID=A0AAN9KS45_CANGL